MVEVAAALLFFGNEILICQRPKNKGNALLWEFPGGKLEPGETPEECLIRECREELGITVSVFEQYAEATHTYPDCTVHLRFYLAFTRERPKLLEHNDMRFVTRDELCDYTFCPADSDLVARLHAQTNALTLRPYRSSDCAPIITLFHRTVHSINLADYTQAQCNVWAPDTIDEDRWQESLSAHTTVTVWDGDILAGFGDLNIEDAYFDRLYVHPCYQKIGVATKIAQALEDAAANAGIQTLEVHASITSRPFFTIRGYILCHAQQVERAGCLLTNFVMKKSLGD